MLCDTPSYCMFLRSSGSPIYTWTIGIGLRGNVGDDVVVDIASTTIGESCIKVVVVSLRSNLVDLHYCMQRACAETVIELEFPHSGSFVVVCVYIAYFATLYRVHISSLYRTHPLLSEAHFSLTHHVKSQ